VALAIPGKATLRKYGLSLEEWRQIADSQGEVCFICGKLPPSNRLCIDHFHAPKFKKMPADEKKKWVRGLLCNYCNLRVASKAINLPKAKRLVIYLQAFEDKRKEEKK